MAACCGVPRCSCRVVAGPGVTVDGNGSAATPYVVASDAAAEPTALQAGDTPTVDATVSGTGSAGDPYIVSADVILDPAPPGGGSNLINAGADGLYLECAQVRGCLSAGEGITYDPVAGEIAAQPTALVTEDSTCVTLAGDGTAGAPLTAVPVIDPAPGNALSCGPDGLLVTPGAVTCDDVRPCLSAGDGIAYDPGTGIIAARPSTDPDNLVGFGTDGGLYAAAPATEPTVVEAGTGTTVTGTGSAADPYTVSATPPETGCGLTGDGSAGAPLTAAVAAWPYACDPDTTAGGVYCDGAGQLRSEPRGQIAFQQNQQVLDFADVTVPAPQDTEVATHNIDIVNPDACRPAFVLLEAEADADFNLPAGAGAGLGMATDEMSYLRNSGSTAILDTHIQGTKVINAGTIPPGGTLTYTLPITMGRGSGGATYNRVQSFVRAFVFVL